MLLSLYIKNKQMKAIKFTWEKGDTFQTIHEKLLGMKGASIVNKKDKKAPFTLFNIGQIEKMELAGMGDGFIKYLDGDEGYQTKNGEYNFKDMEAIPEWGFLVEYGMEDKDGNRVIMSYNFMIPRKRNYEKDVKDTPIVVDENHPFVFYKLK